jgi:uncharacterized membrane protein YbaN (DUF454 family)
MNLMRRWVHLALGFTFVALGALGVVLPVLPTTPFLIVAAYFFSKYDRRFHTWLLRLPWAGSVILQWENERSVSIKVKVVAITMVVVATGMSLYALRQSALGFSILLLVLSALGIGTILKLRTRRPTPSELVREKQGQSA